MFRQLTVRYGKVESNASLRRTTGCSRRHLIAALQRPTKPGFVDQWSQEADAIRPAIKGIDTPVVPEYVTGNARSRRIAR